MFLGIDTSAYTTSLAVVDKENRVLFDSRILLPVPTGKQGLRQSTALFYHLQNFPGMLDELFQTVRGKELLAMAVSTRPRPLTKSYMPVFLAGKSMAQGLARALDVPLLETSHQEGHLAAGLWSAQAFNLDVFLAVHLSGGTSELLLVENKDIRPLQFSIRLLGTTLDISAGQLIDRVGVAMGFDFPAGPRLENVAEEYFNTGKDEDIYENIRISSAVKGYDFSFSGAETKAKELLHKGVPRGIVARAVEDCVAMTIEKSLRKAIQELGIKEVLVVGGVAANKHIKSRLNKRFEYSSGCAKLTYSAREFSSDNAVGVAVIARSTL